jgi:hypothetical protein
MDYEYIRNFLGLWGECTTFVVEKQVVGDLKAAIGN